MQLGARQVDTLREAVEHGVEPDGKQVVGFKSRLVTEEMQLHKQFVSNAAVERCNDVRKGLMKGALAVCNGVTLSQRACS